jgi:hypothetical protein
LDELFQFGGRQLAGVFEDFYGGAAHGCILARNPVYHHSPAVTASSRRDHQYCLPRTNFAAQPISSEAHHNRAMKGLSTSRFRWIHWRKRTAIE